MKPRLIALIVIAAAMTLTSIAAAGPAGTKQRVAIDMKIFPHQTFVFSPMQAGALKHDAGFITNVSTVMTRASSRSVMRDGQSVTVFSPAVWVLEGKLGTLTISERNQWVDVGSDANRDGQPDGIAMGKWKVVRGTGQYANLSGGGRSGHEGLGRIWFSRQEGFVSPR